jgi:hypothetical protein
MAPEASDKLHFGDKMKRISKLRYLLAAFAVAAVSAVPGEDVVKVVFPGKIPDRWSLNLDTTGAKPRTRLLISIEVTQGDNVELVVRERSAAVVKAEPSVLSVQRISREEAAIYWNGFKAIFGRMDLTKPFLDRLDGTHFRMELNVGRSSVACQVSQISDLSEIAPELTVVLQKLRAATIEKP